MTASAAPPHRAASAVVVSSSVSASVFRVSSNTVNTPISEAPARKRTKTARVNLFVEPHPRTAKRFGREVFARILLLRIQGRTPPEIMSEIGCSRDMVEDLLRTFETQAEIAVSDMKVRP